MRPSTPRGRDTRRARRGLRCGHRISATPNGHPLSPPSFGSTAPPERDTATGLWNLASETSTTCRTPWLRPRRRRPAPSGHTGGIENRHHFRVDVGPIRRGRLSRPQKPRMTAFSLASAVVAANIMRANNSPTDDRRAISKCHRRTRPVAGYAHEVMSGSVQPRASSEAIQLGRQGRLSAKRPIQPDDGTQLPERATFACELRLLAGCAPCQLLPTCAAIERSRSVAPDLLAIMEGSGESRPQRPRARSLIAAVRPT